MSSCAQPTPAEKAKQKKQEQEWQAESDLNTMLRFNEIKKDPARLARARARAKEQLATIQAATK